ncbi:hypothetical protein SKAU_G00236740 [Synaphobranchus kaupii]|uniref:protein-tyrosine-phosphatase n=1 Tax=Synaphobranchus kaupii TaxID=118154 RepID=A0A9Q1F6U6_SYNKA|nr:hypothetical protein SKAU_G00236740 [Synaphobranchus kaupii]
MTDCSLPRFWIIRSSLIARLQAHLGAFGRDQNLGLDCQITWAGRGGRRWEHLMPLLRLKRADIRDDPDVMVIHLGGNSIGTYGNTRISLMRRMKADIRQKHYYITTQGPLSQMVDDFWRMAWEWRCHSVVMLTELQEREYDKCFQYWPAEGTVTHGDYAVEMKADTLCDSFSLRDLVLTYVPESQTRLVRHFHFHGWPEIGIPAEGKGMIDFITAVQKQQQKSGNHPIVVHCRY